MHIDPVLLDPRPAITIICEQLRADRCERSALLHAALRLHVLLTLARLESLSVPQLRAAQRHLAGGHLTQELASHFYRDPFTPWLFWVGQVISTPSTVANRAAVLRSIPQRSTPDDLYRTMCGGSIPKPGGSTVWDLLSDNTLDDLDEPEPQVTNVPRVVRGMGTPTFDGGVG